MSGYVILRTLAEIWNPYLYILRKREEKEIKEYKEITDRILVILDKFQKDIDETFDKYGY